MAPEILLAQFQALLKRAPDFDQYSPSSREHAVWCGQAFALVKRWDALEGIPFQSACDHLSIEITRQLNVDRIFGILHRAIADLELDAPDKERVVFAAGEVYDFFRKLNQVIESAETSIFIVDPYLDHTVFDRYLISRKQNVTVRLLLKANANTIKPAAERYIQQYGEVLKIKTSNQIHDRVIFIDRVCWIVGQSLKDAAEAKPTYLVALPPDIIDDKLRVYEDIWNKASSI